MSTTAATLPRQARRARRRSQRALAAEAKATQASVADIERNRHDPGVDRLERLVRPLGYRVTVLRTRSSAAADTAEAVRACLRAGDEDGAFRSVIQFNDDLTREEPALRVALSVTPPAPTGDRRYDALIAGAVEHHLRRAHLPVPAWVAEPARRLPEPWVVDRLAEPDIAQVTPPAFRRHNVLIDAAELASV